MEEQNTADAQTAQPARRMIVSLAAVIMVAVAGLVVFVLGGGGAGAYRDDGTPEGTAYDYQMALLRGDTRRAYDLLSPSLPGYPANAARFEQEYAAAGDPYPDDIDACVYVESYSVAGDGAEVVIREQWNDDCRGGQPAENLSYDFITMQLQLEDGAWRVVSSDRHFAACWTVQGGCSP